MKNGKALLLLLLLIIMVGMIGCSNSSSSGGTTPTPTPTPTPQTPTQKLVGTWNLVSTTDIDIGTFVFRADGTGSFGGSDFHAGRIDNGVFNFTLNNNNQDEAFDITWNSDNNITFTNHNGGGRYTYSRRS